MQVQPRPFGKRNAPPASAPVRYTPARVAEAVAVETTAPDPHRAFFAAIRAEADPVEAGGAVEVPRSLRAGVLAGLVVACALAGVDITAKLAELRGFAGALPGGQPTAALVAPTLVFVAILGGGRSAATSLLFAHAACRRFGQTSHLAYALGGGAAALLVACALIAFGQDSPHGWVVDTLAGAAGGFFYRVFAGSRRKAEA